jgi:hypothetical protein
MFLQKGENCNTNICDSVQGLVCKSDVMNRDTSAVICQHDCSETHSCPLTSEVCLQEGFCVISAAIGNECNVKYNQQCITPIGYECTGKDVIGVNINLFFSLLSPITISLTVIYDDFLLSSKVPELETINPKSVGICKILGVEGCQ